ncbi:MAG: retroviral-like aspartic protease family protein [Bacteroidales bacterium]|nr:retroviral-like aspartic protease family protein [Bacteroidales bacterium]
MAFFFVGMILGIGHVSGQTIYTKDGTELGNREVLITNCIESIGGEQIEIQGLAFSTRNLCSCMIDEVYPQLSSTEILSSLFSNDEETAMQQIMINHYSKIMNCIRSEENGYEAMVRSCVENYFEDLDGEKLPKQKMREYCSCVIDKLLDKNYSASQMKTAEDENGIVHTEVMEACWNQVFGDFYPDNHYVSSDIRGGGSSCRVPIANLLNVQHKVKINVCGIEKYFQFDTGASDFIINDEMADELRSKGFLSDKDFLKYAAYELADNSTVLARQYRIDNITIGDYTVDNVVISVVENGSLLCGLGFLKKFKKWELQGGDVLILYK